jgi:hypothetical protein
MTMLISMILPYAMQMMSQMQYAGTATSPLTNPAFNSAINQQAQSGDFTQSGAYMSPSSPYCSGSS